MSFFLACFYLDGRAPTLFSLAAPYTWSVILAPMCIGIWLLGGMAIGVPLPTYEYKFKENIPKESYHLPLSYVFAVCRLTITAITIIRTAIIFLLQPSPASSPVRSVITILLSDR